MICFLKSTGWIANECTQPYYYRTQHLPRQTDYPFRGLRYPVETLLELFSVGMSLEEILNDYENLEREDLRVALAYAARLSKVKRIETTL